ncbi:MAG: hypothetical protein LUF29_08645, partial [Oscillospiraceae bacterium]|nr:hypothetical protein [Oscillospiraceae bacterium]
SDIDWQVVVEYVDGTTSTTVSASDGTCTVTPEATAISQIYVQSKAAGDIAFTSVSYTLAEEDSGDETSTLVEDVDIATSGWNYTYDATTGTITYTSAWGGCGWWFGSSSELVLSEFTVTTGGEMTYQVVVEYVDGTTSTTVVSSSDGTCTVTPEQTAIKQIYIQGYEAGNLTVTDVSYTVYQDTSLYYVFAFDVQNTSDWGGDWWLPSTQVEGYAEEGEVVTVNIDITDLLTATNLVADGSNLLITNSGETLSNVTMTVTYLDSQNVEQTLTYTVSSVPGSDNTIITTVTSELYNALNTSGTTVTLTFTVGSVSSKLSALTSGYQFIYVNEDYHALIVTREVNSVNRRFLISIPHEDEDHDGYCDTCKEYIGTDEEEAEIVTIDDVEYEVVYSNEDGISAGNWTQVDLGDLDLIEALSQEGAILVITRDTETEVSFADGEYEKFLLIDSWWSNDQTPIALGTAGHTSADEDVIDCTSDDGTTVIYDGSTIYEAWTDGGYADGGTSLVFISNTSASYKIVSIQVLVPVA